MDGNRCCTYDSLNRLTGWNIYQGNSQLQTHSMTYNPSTGNIQAISDPGNYTMNYGANGKPHALTSITGLPGGLPTDNLSITYTDFKKVKTLTEGVKNYTLSYGVDEQRIKSVYKVNNVIQKTRYYMGNYEEEITDGNTGKIHYLSGGNGLAAIYVQNNGNDTLYYAHTDYQGSLTAISLSDGTVKERYAYDPWGNRRNPDNWTQGDTRTAFLFNRGYTMHEHLAEFRVINMNGRVYDPLTAMFFSPDPYVQAPGDWLNYNRYSYCLNNPLKYTDPTGELFGIDDMLIMAIMMGAVMNTGMQMMAGNINSGGDFWKAAGIGALAGAAGYGAGALVGGALKIGGVAGGSLIGAAGGSASGFVGGAGNAWVNGASFGDGLKAGLIGGGIGALSGALIGGLTRGISDYDKGYDFWDGSKDLKFTLGTNPNEAMVSNYNSSIPAEADIETLQGRLYDEFGIKEGDWNIKEITTKTIKGEGLTSSGNYIDTKTNEIYGGHTRLYSSGKGTILRVSPHYTNTDIVSFRAIAGHELIHAGHRYYLPNVVNLYTERVAHQYTINTFMNNGMHLAAKNAFQVALGYSYIGWYPQSYNPFFMIGR